MQRPLGCMSSIVPRRERTSTLVPIWIGKTQLGYTEAEDKVDILRIAQHPPRETAKMKLKQAMSESAILELEINLEVAALEDALMAAMIGLEAHEGFVTEKGRVESKLAAHHTRNKELVALAMQLGEDEHKLSEIVSNEKQFRTALAPKMASITTNIIQKRPAPALPPTAGGSGRTHQVAAQEGAQENIRSGSGVQKKHFIKYQPKKMPEFSGRAKDYALWKKLWQEGISPQYEESAQMMAFTTCLPEKVWKKIGKMDNITRVWDELDRHYGAPKIVTAEFLAELEQLRLEKGREDFIPMLMIMLEDAARLLDAIDHGDRVKSEQQVEHWVIILPDGEQDKYFMVQESLQGSDWERLIKFLSGRKRAIQDKLIHREYVPTSPRKNRKDVRAEVVCAYPKCGRTGHEIKDCHLYKADQAQLDGKGRVKEAVGEVLGEIEQQ